MTKVTHPTGAPTWDVPDPAPFVAAGWSTEPEVDDDRQVSDAGPGEVPPRLGRRSAQP